MSCPQLISVEEVLKREHRDVRQTEKCEDDQRYRSIR